MPDYEFCRKGFYFEDDSDLSMYSITCRDNGTYTDVPMKRCIDPEGNRAFFARYRVLGNSVLDIT